MRSLIRYRNEEEAWQALEKKDKYNIIVGSFITPEFARNFQMNSGRRDMIQKYMKMEGSDFELVSAESHKNLQNCDFPSAAVPGYCCIRRVAIYKVA